MSKETTLYVIPTPIGNLEDITLRALRLLREVDVILAEDTRTTGRLLKHYEITQKMQSYHIHNEHKALAGIIAKMQAGQQVALVSDAGTPAISDPGFLLVRACREANIRVECLPGATAFVPALVQSGLPNDSFVFEGFLPPKKGRQTKLNSLRHETRTMVFYESPHRLLKSLAQFKEVFGEDRYISVSREISKLHEEYITASLAEVEQYFLNKPSIKGEFVLVLSGSSYTPRSLTDQS